MKPNTAPNGTAYGYVAAQDLDSDLVHELMYGAQARNLSEIAAEGEEASRQRMQWEEACENEAVHCQENNLPAPIHEDFEFDPPEGFDIEEPTIEGVKDGVFYTSSWLGGALNFFIIDSPHTTDEAHRASPCVPGAGILKHPSARCGGVTSFDVPADWWAA